MLNALTQSGMVNPIRSKIRQSRYSGTTVVTYEVGQINKNINVILGVKGTGYISRYTPDGTAAGGNQRGNYAVDLQASDDNAIKVASGDYSGALSGYGHRVSGAQSVACGGVRSIITQFGSGVVAGSGNIITNFYSFIGAGNGNSVSGQSSGVLCGENNLASGLMSAVGGGDRNISAGSYSDAGGYYANASKYGQRARASGRFSAAGDCQSSGMVARASTSNATPSNLFLDGSSARITVDADTVGRCTIRLVARDNTAGAQWATADRIVSWWRGVAVGTTVISAIDTVGTDRGSNAGAWPAGWALAITADVANGAIDIRVTGAAATNIRWGVSISDFAEVTFA